MSKTLRIGAALLMCVFLAGGAGFSYAASASLFENWDAAAAPDFLLLSPGQSLAQPNVTDVQASDQKALRLQLAAGAAPGPGNGPQAETNTALGYGIYRARLKTADCTGHPQAGVVTGYFVYFNDGQDYNGDGLPDNTEIDFEWLCAAPHLIYLTMWTDYRDSDEVHKRVARLLNLATGEIIYTCYFETFGDCQPLDGAANQPQTIFALPGYNSSIAYYEYGFSWSARQAAWWLVDPTTRQPILLWDYRGPEARIPAPPADYMVNVWHTATWTPEGFPGATQSPSVPVSGYVDWMRFSSLPWRMYLPLMACAPGAACEMAEKSSNAIFSGAMHERTRILHPFSFMIQNRFQRW